MAIPKLIPGFRFHPTGVELIKYFLKRKVMGKKFHADVIAELDIYKYAPWDLPDMSYLKSGDLEWYFFCPIEKKYGSGGRLNRATEIGFWKATGKDRAVQHNNHTVGMIKTLVFHTGKAPRGDRTDWVMHEYRLEDKDLADKGIVQDSYVICRVFQKEGPGPQNGAQYGKPFIEDDSDDEMGIPFVESTAHVPSLPVTPISCVMNGQHLQPSRCSGFISMPCQSGLTPSPTSVNSCQTGLIPSPDPANSCQSGLTPSPTPVNSCQTGLIPSPDPANSCQSGLMPSPDPASSCQIELTSFPDPANSCQTGSMPFPDPVNSCQTGSMPFPDPMSSCQTGSMPSPDPMSSCQTELMPSPYPANPFQTGLMLSPYPVNSCQTGQIPSPDPVNSCQTGQMPSPEPVNWYQTGSMPSSNLVNSCQTGSMPTPDPVISCQTELTPSPDPASISYPDNQAANNDDDIISMLDIFKDDNTLPEENIAEGALLSDFFEGLGDLNFSTTFGSFYQNADFSTDGMGLIDLDSELFW